MRSNKEVNLTQSFILEQLFWAVIIAISLLTNSNTAAASECQGLPQMACAAERNCLWVNGYTRSDGRAVKSYCRIKPKGKRIEELSGKPDQRRADQKATG